MTAALWWAWFCQSTAALTAGDAQGDFSDGGSVWRSMMTVQVTGTTLTVHAGQLGQQQLGAVQRGAPERPLSGNYGADDDAQLQSGSIAVDAGDPNTPSLSEPQPNGGRVDVGAYGNTPNATASLEPADPGPESGWTGEGAGGHVGQRERGQLRTAAL